MLCGDVKQRGRPRHARGPRYWGLEGFRSTLVDNARAAGSQTLAPPDPLAGGAWVDAARARDDDAWERCVRWVVASGGAVGAATLGDDAGVRGVVAAAGGIEAGAAVLEIPLRCCVLAACGFSWAPAVSRPGAT